MCNGNEYEIYLGYHPGIFLVHCKPESQVRLFISPSFSLLQHCTVEKVIDFLDILDANAMCFLMVSIRLALWVEVEANKFRAILQNALIHINPSHLLKVLPECPKQSMFLLL